jgi:hypothetical protein
MGDATVWFMRHKNRNNDISTELIRRHRAMRYRRDMPRARLARVLPENRGLTGKRVIPALGAEEALEDGTDLALNAISELTLAVSATGCRGPSHDGLSSAESLCHVYCFDIPPRSVKLSEIDRKRALGAAHVHPHAQLLFGAPLRSLTSATRVREIAAHCSAVEVVARALLEHERLEALEIYRIVVRVR